MQLASSNYINIIAIWIYTHMTWWLLVAKNIRQEHVMNWNQYGDKIVFCMLRDL